MIGALDAAYATGPDGVERGLAALAVATSWSDPGPFRVTLSAPLRPEPYAPGAFYRRELPLLRAVLDAARTERAVPPAAILLVDGYAVLDRSGSPGLGARLFEAIEGRAAVIGVAKTPLRGDDLSIAIRRGRSATPLYVTAIGIDPAEAAAGVSALAGGGRIPELAKAADRAARDAIDQV